MTEDGAMGRMLVIPPIAMRTVAIDFDGPIHDYQLGFHDGTCYGGAVPGVLYAMKKLMETRPVAVFTARPLDMVWDWFNIHAPSFPTYVDHGLHRHWWDEQGAVLLTNRKIIAAHYIDDRAIRFVPTPGRPDAWEWTLNAVLHEDQRARIQDGHTCD